MHTATLVTFLIYLGALISLGIVFYRYSKTLSDYILGGRRLRSGVAALSAGASDMSGWLLLGLPGAVYAAGINQIWIAVGLSIGAFLNWNFTAARLRVFTEIAGNAITIPDFLEQRFEDRSHLLRIVSATVILIFFAVYTASGLVAGAKLFESAFGWGYHPALFTGTAVIVLYTFLGGFLAVSWTDFFQGLLMLFALTATPVLLFFFHDNWSSIVSVVSSVNPQYLDATSGLTLIGLLSLLAWGFGYFGQPHILARFMAIDSPKSVPRAMGIGMGWMVMTLAGAVLIGFAGISYFADSPLADPEFVFIELVQQLFSPWLAGILLAAILSAVMSTVDSQLLVCSSAITDDFYKSLLRPKAAQKELVAVGRASVAAVAVAALVMALNPESMVLDLVAYAWAGFGASFGSVILFSLYWRRMTRNGALAGVITGALTVLVWRNLQGGVFDLYEILPGFIFSSLAIIIFSHIGGEPSEKTQNLFDRARLQ